MKILHLDCSSGVSGDMLLGALIDLGASPRAIVAELRKLKLPRWSWTVQRVPRGEFHGVHVDVKSSARRHGLIADVLRRGPKALPGGVGDRGVRILRRVLAAEAKVHGKAVAHVHLHELEDLDTIVDVFGVLIALRLLGVERVFTSAVSTGFGTVRAAHGVLPVPAPGTAELLIGQRIQLGVGSGELATPTGAALVAELAEPGPPPPLTLTRIGAGAGTRNPPGRANLLRAMLGEAGSSAGAGLISEEICQLEAMVDDMSPQLVESFLERAYLEGAVEAWSSPVSGKRSRPGISLVALCRPPRIDSVLKAFLEETGTLGVRVIRTERVSLPRQFGSVSTPFGRIRVKYAGQGASAHAIPEWRDVCAAAKRSGVPARLVLETARKSSGNAELTTRRAQKRQR